MLDNEHLIPSCCARSHGGEYGVIGQKESFTVGVMNLVVGDIESWNVKLKVSLL